MPGLRDAPASPGSPAFPASPSVPAIKILRSIRAQCEHAKMLGSGPRTTCPSSFEIPFTAFRLWIRESSVVTHLGVRCRPYRPWAQPLLAGLHTPPDPVTIGTSKGKKIVCAIADQMPAKSPQKGVTLCRQQDTHMTATTCPTHSSRGRRQHLVAPLRRCRPWPPPIPSRPQAPPRQQDQPDLPDAPATCHA
jgi:hypothetical protein